MAISINKVYRTVLSIMNKEGRGFLTPDQFNRIGREVQLDLLERAFFDYNKAVNKEKANIKQLVELGIFERTDCGWCWPLVKCWA